MKLEITNILQDRNKQETTVYLKGCPLRCSWCDRPQVRKPKKELLYDVESCIDCMVCFPECSFDAHDFVNGHNLDGTNGKDLTDLTIIGRKRANWLVENEQSSTRSLQQQAKK